MENDTITKGKTVANSALVNKLREFKEIYCDENVLIADAIRRHFSTWLNPVILDVGAGLGDIASAAFPEIAAVLLDTEDWGATASPNHSRAVADFFDYARSSPAPIGTVLFCHVLQYLDDVPMRLRAAVRRIAPRSVLTVLNDNDGVFGEIMRWSLDNVQMANPELPIVPVDFNNYRKVATAKVSATMDCPSFEIMAENVVSVLIDSELSGETMAGIRDQLSRRLKSPSMIINQTIACYERI